MASVDRNASLVAARMCGNDAVMDETAAELLALAHARALQHVLTGAYISQLSVANVAGRKGVRDRLVIAGDKAAVSIEYGHSVRINRGPNALQNSMNFRWVPGQFILSGAMNAMPGFGITSFGRVAG